MTEDADRIEPDAQGGEGREAPPPIIIVQRGGASWGRELLLLILLLSTGAYIGYREYLGPRIVLSGEPRAVGRVVDAVPTAPLADGGVVLRAAGGAPDPESPAAAGPTDRPSAQAPPPVVPGAPDRSDPATAEGAVDDESEATAVADRGGDRPPAPIVEPPAPGEELPGSSAEGPTDRPRRASSVIVFDPDRRDPPVVEPPLPPAEEPRGLGEGPIADREAVRVAERPPEPETLAERRQFLQILAFGLRQYGRRAGPHIVDLCRDSRRPLPPEVALLEQRHGSGLFLQGPDLERTVTALRGMGAPEAYLLERLSEQMSRTIGARHGPRDPMEARVFAARKLLAIPLPAATPAHAAAAGPAPAAW